ncbi:MAG: hypothetical protein QOJ23_4797 [Actinomycetota bacterium]|nr:hypothetical protein [Actinomycetota bacterium]MDQ1500628.1 hypothetical protein [Actinomycetota bacterium]MDQ1565666.1 hypothetical protein [Actinomycetota bacterium]
MADCDPSTDDVNYPRDLREVLAGHCLQLVFSTSLQLRGPNDVDGVIDGRFEAPHTPYLWRLVCCKGPDWVERCYRILYRPWHIDDQLKHGYDCFHIVGILNDDRWQQLVTDFFKG